MDWRRGNLNKYQYDVSPADPDFPKTVYYVSDDLCGWKEEVAFEADRDRVLAERWAQVGPAYGADLDAILGPLVEWRKLAEPADRPPTKVGHTG